MANAIEGALEQVRLLRWVVTQGREAALRNPPPELVARLPSGNPSATSVDFRRGVERHLDDLDLLLDQMGFLLVVQAFEGSMRELLETTADGIRLSQRLGREPSRSILRERLVRTHNDLGSLRRIADVIKPLLLDRKAEFQMVIDQRNALSHGADPGRALAVTVEQAFEVLSAVAGLCESAAADRPEQPGPPASSIPEEA